MVVVRKKISDLVVAAVERKSVAMAKIGSRGGGGGGGLPGLTCVREGRDAVARRMRNPCADNDERRDRTWLLQSEVNYDVNPTDLYRLIERKDWRKVVALLDERPHEASTWVYRYEEAEGGDNGEQTIRWRLLPIHGAIVFHAPVHVVDALIGAYPNGTEEADDQCMIPLHLTCRTRHPDEAVVRALLDAFPQGVLVADKKGRTPLDILAISKNVPPEHKSAIAKIFEERRSELRKYDAAKGDRAALNVTGVEMAYVSSKSRSFDSSAYYSSFGSTFSLAGDEEETYDEGDGESRIDEEFESGMDTESGFESGMDTESGFETGVDTETEFEAETDVKYDTDGFDEETENKEVVDDGDEFDKDKFDRKHGKAAAEGEDASGIKGVKEQTQNEEKKPRMKLLIHGVLPSGRPLTLERKPDEDFEFLGVLPSGRQVQVNERDANITSQTLSFATASPRTKTYNDLTAETGNMLHHHHHQHQWRQRQMINGGVPKVLQMTFPLEVASVGRSNSPNRDTTERKGTSAYNPSGTRDDTFDHLIDDADGVSVCLKRIETMEKKRLENQADTKHLEDDASMDGNSSYESPFCPVAAEANIEERLMEPKPQLKKLLLTITGGRACRGTVGTSSSTLGEEVDSFQSHDQLSVISSNTATREEQRLVNQTRRENACGALKTMAFNKAARGLLARTRGVIPTLSTVLCATDSSFNQRQRCMSTLVYLSQHPRACDYMLHFRSLPLALKDAANDESPEIRHLACLCLASLARRKANRRIIAEGCDFLNSAVRIIDLASGFDAMKPKGANNVGPSRTLHAIKKFEAIECVLSDMTRETMGSFDSTDDQEGKLNFSAHELYFSARTNTLKILLGISNIPALTTSMARDPILIARLLKSARKMNETDNTLCVAILTNLTRHPDNAMHLVNTNSFVEVMLAEIDAPGDERRKCALYALQNLSCEKEPRQSLVENDKLFQTLTAQFCKSSNPDIRVSILHTMRNLSNEQAFLIIIPTVPIMLGELYRLSKDGDDAMKRYLASDTVANLSRWLLASADLGYQAKMIQQGDTKCNPVHRLLSLRTYTWDQWN